MEVTVIVDVVCTKERYDVYARYENGAPHPALQYKGFTTLAEVEHFLYHAPLSQTEVIRDVRLLKGKDDTNGTRWIKVCDSFDKDKDKKETRPN